MDGKLAVAYFRDRLWVYARANLAVRGGARHVQVTHSSPLTGLNTSFSAPAVEGLPPQAPDHLGWSQWEALRMGFTVTQETNIYYINVQVVDNGNRLLGLMPATGVATEVDMAAASAAADARLDWGSTPYGGIFLSTSTNGVDWSRPRLLMRSRTLGSRVEDHPIGYVPAGWSAGGGATPAAGVDGQSSRGMYTLWARCPLQMPTRGGWRSWRPTHRCASHGYA